MNDLYYPIPRCLTADTLNLLTEYIATNSENFIEITKATHVTSLGIDLNNKILHGDIFLRTVITNFTNLKIIIFKNFKKSMMHWHKDRYRGCAINIPIHEMPKSFTLFGEPEGNDYLNISQVLYEVGRPVLLNTTESHCVLNLSEMDRYILSIGFLHPNTYQDTYRYLQDTLI